MILFLWQQQPALSGRGQPLTVCFRDYFQYQRVAEPVFNPDAAIPEISFPDRWYSPLSLPSVFFRQIQLKPRTAYTQPIAAYETEESLTPEAVTADRFVKSMEDPPEKFRRTELRRREYLYPTEFTAFWYFPTAVELGGHIGWYSPLSQPPKFHEAVSQRQRAYSHPFTMEPPYESTSPPEPMPDAVLSTQLVTYPLPHHQPEFMVAG